MKTAIKILAVMTIVLGFWSSEGSAQGLTPKQEQAARDAIVLAIRAQQRATQTQIRAIEAQLGDPALTRDERIALTAERRSLITMNRQLESRTKRASSWSSFQVVYFGRIFAPISVSPA